MDVKRINPRSMGIPGLRKSLAGRDRGPNASDHGVATGRRPAVAGKKRESRGSITIYNFECVSFLWTFFLTEGYNVFFRFLEESDLKVFRTATLKKRLSLWY